MNVDLDDEMKFDLYCRRLFGMFNLEDQGLFGGRTGPTLAINMTDNGRACSSPLDDIYSTYTDNMRCATQQSQLYRAMIDHIKNLIPDYNFHIVMIDLANMLKGRIIHQYLNFLNQLPVQYKLPESTGLLELRPVIYIVVKPVSLPEAPVFYGNKLILPTACVIPIRNKLQQCPGKGVGETDDILLVQIYEFIYRDFPDHIGVLSGDNYRWMGTYNLPKIDIQYLRLSRKSTGMSGYTLKRNTARYVGRGSAYDVATHDSFFGTPREPKHLQKKTQRSKDLERASARQRRVFQITNPDQPSQRGQRGQRDQQEEAEADQWPQLADMSDSDTESEPQTQPQPRPLQQLRPSLSPRTRPVLKLAPPSKPRERKNMDRLCRQYTSTGRCDNGDRCPYAHGMSELSHKASEKGPQAFYCKKPRCTGVNCKSLHPGEIKYLK